MLKENIGEGSARDEGDGEAEMRLRVVSDVRELRG
jgi:hypothetical protein